MAIRPMLEPRPATTPLLVAGFWLLTTGCASLANTPAQELAWSRWTACHPRAAGAAIRTVQMDGRISFWYDGPADRSALLDCIRLPAADRPALPEPISEPRECSGTGDI